MPSVWIINHYAGFPETVPATRTYELARRLAGRGWHVTVVACSFNHYSFTPDFPEHRRGATTVTRDGVRWVLVRGVPYSGNGAARFRNMAAFSARVEQWARKQPTPDVVIGTTVHPFAAESARRIARRRGSAFVYEVTDLWPESLVDLGHTTRGSGLFRLMASLEERAFRSADGVIGLPPLVDRYANDAYGLDLDLYAYIPNGSIIPPRPKPTPEVVEGSLVYAGGFAPAHGLDVIVDATQVLERMRPGRFHVHYFGDGPERTRLEERIERTGLAHVSTFHGLVPKRTLIDALPTFDIGLCTGAPLRVHRYGVSTNKLFDYFAAARPVVFAVDSENNPVTMAGAGRSVPASKPDELARAVLELDTSGAAARATLGANGRAFLETEHAFDILAARLETFLQTVLAERRIRSDQSAGAGRNTSRRRP